MYQATSNSSHDNQKHTQNSADTHSSGRPMFMSDQRGTVGSLGWVPRSTCFQWCSWGCILEGNKVAAKTTDEDLLVHKLFILTTNAHTEEKNNKKTAQMLLNCTTGLKLDFFFSPPVYSCVSFLPPRPEFGFYSLEKVFLLLFEPVLALYPSAPIAVPLWWELPGGQTEVFFSALCLLTMTPSGQSYNFPT